MIPRPFSLLLQQWRLNSLGRPQWWRRLRRRRDRAIRGALRRQVRRGYIANQRKNASLIKTLAQQSLWLAVTALLLLVGSELAAVGLSHVKLRPIHLFSHTLDLGLVWKPFEYLSRAIDPGKYDSLAAAAVGAEATLLALFYATIGVVAATAYSSVPGDIRSLFVNERTSDVYTRGIVRAFVFTTALLTMGALGHHARVLTLVIAALLAINAALRLLIAGTAPFRFFDPATLTEPLPARFQDALRVASQPPTANDEGSQRQAHGTAADILEYYRRITDLLASREVPNSDGPLRVARQILRVNSHYATIKDVIPSESRWWSSVTNYPNWFTLSSSATETALSTSTGSLGTVGKDLYWIERQSISDLCQLLDAMPPSQLNELTAFVDKVALHIRALSARLQLTEAELFEEHIATSVWNAINERPIDDADERRSFQRDRVIASQRATLVLTNASLGVTDLARSVSSWDLESAINEAIMGTPKIYALALPRIVVQLLEQLAARIDIEKYAEGKQITPSWWIHHQAARALTAQLLEAHNSIIARLNSRTIPSLEAATEREDWEVAAMTALAALELVAKIEVQSNVVRAALESLKARRSAAIAADPRWPELPDTPPLEPTAKAHILETLSDCLPHLSSERHQATRLDLYGQAYVFLFGATFDALLDNNTELADTLFTTLFAQTQAVTGRLIRDLEAQLLPTQITYVSEPVVGMMELSGAAILLQALHQRGAWDLIRPHWERYREAKGDNFIRYLVAVISDLDSTWGLSEPYVMRTSRRRRVDDLLRERGVIRADRFSWPTEATSTPDENANPILTAFAPSDYGSPWDLTDLFLVEYVKPVLPQDCSLPQSARALAQTIAEPEDGDDDA